MSPLEPHAGVTGCSCMCSRGPKATAPIRVKAAPAARCLTFWSRFRSGLNDGLGRLRQLPQLLHVLGVHRLSSAVGGLDGNAVAIREVPEVGPLAGQEVWPLVTRALGYFLDVLTCPEPVAAARLLVQHEFLGANERLRQVDRIHPVDVVREHVAVADE